MASEYGPNVTKADMEAVKALPGIFTDRVFVQIVGTHIRLNLGAMVSGEPVYHSSVVMPADEALGYADLIKSMAEVAIEQSARLKQIQHVDNS